MVTKHSRKGLKMTARINRPVDTTYYNSLVGVYVLVVHTSGNGFALDFRYDLKHSEVANAAEVIAQVQGMSKDGPVKIKSHMANWLPTQPAQRPKWIEGRPASEFTAYWFTFKKVAA